MRAVALCVFVLTVDCPWCTVGSLPLLISSYIALLC